MTYLFHILCDWVLAKEFIAFSDVELFSILQENVFKVIPVH